MGKKKNGQYLYRNAGASESDRSVACLASVRYKKDPPPLLLLRPEQFFGAGSFLVGFKTVFRKSSVRARGAKK
jgi:hypothetical protein